MGAVWNWLASTVGDLWVDWSIVALWPWPATLIGNREGIMLWSDYRAFTHALRPGDFLLTRAAPYVGSNSSIPGALKHGMVYVGGVKGEQELEGKHLIHGVQWLGLDPLSDRHTFDRCVVHAISEGVVAQDFGQCLFEDDYCIAVRPWASRGEQEAVAKAAIENLGKPYDFEFEFDDEREVCCTELLRICCAAARIPEPASMSKRLSPLGKPKRVFLADSFAQTYKPICCSRSCLAQKFQSWAAEPARMCGVVAEAWKERNR